MLALATTGTYQIIMFRWSPIIFIEIKHLFKIQTEANQKFLFLWQLMIIVDDAGSFIPAMNHSPWDGVTVADFVMPFFLFIVGVALALAYKVVHARWQKRYGDARSPFRFRF